MFVCKQLMDVLYYTNLVCTLPQDTQNDNGSNSDRQISITEIRNITVPREILENSLFTFGLFDTIENWFNNHRRASYYIVLIAGSALTIGGAVLTALVGPVGLIITAVNGIMAAYVAPAIREGSRLKVTKDGNSHTLRYRTENSEYASYIKSCGKIKIPRVVGSYWGQTRYHLKAV